ncbi:MAG: hypothetical protein CBD51_002395 [Flavobacteriales bacterium TMED191]|nr:MAG: hypothetical protein CBD51_002395 [Flavobacteriales bacterium TMED191]|tara:strand:- start:6 stop:746 length:741 start_codon:yes stop_codon:yes gene_type:complete
MKLIKFTFLLIFPSVIIGQNTECGDRPVKPQRIENQTIKNYKDSENFINYKNNLKQWKYCTSPLGIDERESKRLENQKQKRLESQNEEPINKCGDRPDKPKRPKGTSIDEFRQTHVHILYREKLKIWKQCMSPKQLTEPVFSKKKEITKSPCGNKPNKPLREDGMDHEEYKQTSEYKIYRSELKIWKSCEEDYKKEVLWGDCGKKPKKPARNEGMNHEEYKQTSEYQTYRQSFKNWKKCIDSNKKE